MKSVLTVGFILLPAFTMTPFAALVDMIRLAADEGDRSRQVNASWRVLGSAPVKSSAGILVAPDEPVGDLARFDYVVLCGGLINQRKTLSADLVHALGGAKCIVGLCTASFALAEAGLMNNRRACVSWFHYAAFRVAFPTVRATGTEIFVVDGPVITCAGGTGALDVGAWIIERHLGLTAARKALDILLADGRRDRSAPQPHRASEALSDARLRVVALLVEQKLGNPPNVTQLATAVGISTRQLARLFVSETGLTPSAFLRDARLAQSRWLMETTNQSLSHIATETGFADAAHFSRAFRQRFGVSPSMVERRRGTSDQLTPNQLA